MLISKRNLERSLLGIRRLLQSFGWDTTHAEVVCKNCMDLFDATAELHHLGKDEQRILAAAALLHDIGYPVDPDNHHKASRDRIMESELNGFSNRERQMTACVARYHRKTLPKPNHKIYCDLNEHDQHIVDKLAALLRIADGLDRGHDASVESMRFDIKKKSARLSVYMHGTHEIDLWGANRKKDLFEKTFGVALEIMSE